jgi:glycosyltransferase involved in cell wall biosynthesis
MNVYAFCEGPATLSMRMSPLLEYFSNHGIKCRLIKPKSYGILENSKLGGIFSILLRHPIKDYLNTIIHPPDVVIIAKTSSPQMLIFQRLLQKKKTKILFDLTDAMFLCDSKMFGISVRSGSFCLEKVIMNSDFVTTNGHYLLDYVKNYNEECDIIQDPIDCNVFYPTGKNKNSPVVIGWEGNPSAHFDNLKMLVEPLMRLSDHCDFKLKLVSSLGDVKIRKMFEPLEGKVEIDFGSNKWLSTTEFAESVSEFDVLLAPIQQSAWYEGKSALRVGIGMALGIPVIASPVGEQKYVVQHGFNGYLAKNQAEWYTYLEMLVNDRALRHSIGVRGRKTAIEQLSTSVCGEKLHSILSNL